MAAEETLQATVDALKAQVEKNEVSALASCAVLHHAPPSHRLAATPAPAAESNGHLLSPVCRLSGLPYAGRVCSARRWIDPNEVGEEHPPQVGHGRVRRWNHMVRGTRWWVCPMRVRAPQARAVVPHPSQGTSLALASRSTRAKEGTASSARAASTTPFPESMTLAAPATGPSGPSSSFNTHLLQQQRRSPLARWQNDAPSPATSRTSCSLWAYSTPSWSTGARRAARCLARPFHSIAPPLPSPSAPPVTGCGTQTASYRPSTRSRPAHSRSCPA